MRNMLTSVINNLGGKAVPIVCVVSYWANSALGKILTKTRVNTGLKVSDIRRILNLANESIAI
tara:strand:+ start:99 stop:287 length:189 start_codon:yes stop_codon:yes gene_type:complete